MPFNSQPESVASPERSSAIAAAVTGEPQLLTSPLGRPLARTFILRVSPQAVAGAADLSTTIYPVPDRRRIVTQLRLVISDFYVHLAIKRAQYGFDPVRALELLSAEVENLPDAEFHQAVTQLIARTRDRHLRFVGRAPVGLVAALPFMVERAWDGVCPEVLEDRRHRNPLEQRASRPFRAPQRECVRWRERGCRRGTER